MHARRFETTRVELIWGEGKFTGPKTIEVTGTNGEKRTVSSDRAVVYTGSRVKTDDIPGLRDAAPLTHIEILELEEVPSHLLILGVAI